MKTIIINYFASLGTFMGFVIFLFTSNIPAAILMLLLFTFCLIWFSEIMKRWSQRVKERRQCEPKDEPWNTCKIDIPLDDEPEKPKGNVRTGMYPSEKYYQMVAEREAKA